MVWPVIYSYSLQEKANCLACLNLGLAVPNNCLACFNFGLAVPTTVSISYHWLLSLTLNLNILMYSWTHSERRTMGFKMCTHSTQFYFEYIYYTHDTVYYKLYSTIQYTLYSILKSTVHTLSHILSECHKNGLK